MAIGRAALVDGVCQISPALVAGFNLSTGGRFWVSANIYLKGHHCGQDHANAGQSAHDSHVWALIRGFINPLLRSANLALDEIQKLQMGLQQSVIRRG